MGLSHADLLRVNQVATAFARGLQAQHATADLPIVVNGVVGPKGDGYTIGQALEQDEAQFAHRAQVVELAACGT